MFDLTTQDKLFNEYITPGVVAEIKSRSKLFDEIRTDWKQVEPGGRYARQKLMMAGSQATGARSDPSYPDAQESTPAESLVYIKRAQMFTMQFDGLALEAAARSGTPVSPMDFEKKGLFIQLADDMSRQLMLDGSGVICVANGSGSGTASLIVDSTYFADATMFLRAKRVIDAYLSTAQEIDGIALDSVDSITTATLASTQSWTTDANIYGDTTYTAAATAGVGEMMGLEGIIRNTDPPTPNATGGLQGLTVALNPEWKAVVNDNPSGTGGTDREMTETLIYELLHDMDPFAGEVDVFLTTEAVWRKYFELMKEYVTLPGGGPGRKQWGGSSGLIFNYNGKDLPVVADKFVPDGYMYGVSSKELVLHTLNPNIITWEKGTGAGGYMQKVSGYNRFVVEGHIFSNLATGLRKAFGVIRDITES